MGFDSYILKIFTNACFGLFLQISGALIVPVALILMVYALVVYRVRTMRILRRESVRYDDQRGPLLLTVLLVVVLLIAYAISIHFSF